MSFLFPHPSPPPPPPPPPAAPALANPSIAEQGAAERERLSSAEGAGFSGADVTGGTAGNPATTANMGGSSAKTVLGG